MIRVLKRNLKVLLPQSCRRFIKKLLYPSRRSSTDNLIVLSQEGDLIRCAISGVGSFITSGACRPDLEFHSTNFTAVEEFYGIALLAKQHRVLFDIGAHAGLVSAMFCSANAMNKAYSFEPSPVSVKRLEEIRMLNHFESRIDIQPIAIGESSREVEMLIDTVGGFAQVQQFEYTGSGFSKRIQVRVESIADAAKRIGIVPDLIKIDVEGYEFEVIKGATSFLAQHQPTICLELHLDYLEERTLSVKSLLSMLADCGYVFSMYSGELVTARQIYNSHLPVFRFVAKRS